jgi:hypothetical protein
MSQDNEMENAREKLLELWSRMVSINHPVIDILASKLAELHVDVMGRGYEMPLAIIEALLSTVIIHVNVKNYEQTKYVMWSLIEWCIEEIKFFDENGYWRFLEINQ